MGEGEHLQLQLWPVSPSFRKWNRAIKEGGVGWKNGEGG
jgi:hypothetical protein